VSISRERVLESEYRRRFRLSLYLGSKKVAGKRSLVGGRRS